MNFVHNSLVYGIPTRYPAWNSYSRSLALACRMSNKSLAYHSHALAESRLVCVRKCVEAGDSKFSRSWSTFTCCTASERHAYLLFLSQKFFIFFYHISICRESELIAVSVQTFLWLIIFINLLINFITSPALRIFRIIFGFVNHSNKQKRKIVKQNTLSLNSISLILSCKKKVAIFYQN